MSRRSRIVVVALAVLALSLALVASALANAFSQVYQSYRKSGHVDPCRFSVSVLNQAKAQVPPDIDQYAPDFPAALDAALGARARGACGAPTPQAGAPTTAPATPAATSTPPPAGRAGSSINASSGSSAGSAASTPAPTAAASPAAPAALAVAGHTSSGGGGAPAAIIALAVLAGLLALAAGAWGLARWRGWDPPWLEHAAHSFAEAGVRAEATWAEFADWVRLGR